MSGAGPADQGGGARRTAISQPRQQRAGTRTYVRTGTEPQSPRVCVSCRSARCSLLAAVQPQLGSEHCAALDHLQRTHIPIPMLQEREIITSTIRHENTEPVSTTTTNETRTFRFAFATLTTGQLSLVSNTHKQTLPFFALRFIKLI